MIRGVPVIRVPQTFGRQRPIMTEWLWKMGIIGVGTQCYGHVKAELVLLADNITKTDFGQYDHVVEGGMEIKSGMLQILNCPDSEIALTIKVRPGKYRVRVYSSKLATVIGDDGNDHYKIEVWPDNNLSRKVLKQYISKK